MMEFIKQQTGQFHIQALSSEGILINQITYRQSLLLTPGKLIAPWPVQAWTDIDLPLIEQLLGYQPDWLLFGGAEPLPELRRITAICQQLQMGCEVMDSLAAVKTYQILSNDEKRIVFGLLIPTTEF